MYHYFQLYEFQAILAVGETDTGAIETYVIFIYGTIPGAGSGLQVRLKQLPFRKKLKFHALLINETCVFLISNCDLFPWQIKHFFFEFNPIKILQCMLTVLVKPSNSLESFEGMRQPCDCLSNGVAKQSCASCEFRVDAHVLRTTLQYFVKEIVSNEQVHDFIR